jgi:hypothetical protein
MQMAFELELPGPRVVGHCDLCGTPAAKLHYDHDHGRFGFPSRYPSPYHADRVEWHSCPVCRPVASSLRARPEPNSHIVQPRVAPNHGEETGHYRLAVPTDEDPGSIYTAWPVKRLYSPFRSTSGPTCGVLRPVFEPNKPNIHNHFQFRFWTADWRHHPITLRRGGFSPNLWTSKVRYGPRNSIALSYLLASAKTG